MLSIIPVVIFIKAIEINQTIIAQTYKIASRVFIACSCKIFSIVILKFIAD